ncbi:MAG: CBS domain-containing protein [Planctomycetota bacterium]
MSLRNSATRYVATAAPSALLREIVQKMRDQDVGSVVIVSHRRPVGIITDRDLVMRVIGEGKDPNTVRADSVMTTDIATVPETMDALLAAALMRERGVRRLPVVDEQGCLAGIVTLDDLLCHVRHELDELADVIAPLPFPHEGG